jgi:hypothetical protein
MQLYVGRRQIGARSQEATDRGAVGRQRPSPLFLQHCDALGRESSEKRFDVGKIGHEYGGMILEAHPNRQILSDRNLMRLEIRRRTDTGE